jgi:2-keto-4-pentenoate hydratase/2-oxohepta-3-ene-1,7-dioic acid hydratase in catechol pathway
MVFSVAQLISYISDWLPLNPGDMIASGTMAGVGFARQPPVFMRPGDRAEVSISRIGTLANSVQDEAIAA